MHVDRHVRLEGHRSRVEGGGPFRYLLDGSQELVAHLVASVRKQLAGLEDDPPGIMVPELDVDTRYEAWSPTVWTLERQ